jgi:hypothetical protein
MRISVRPIHSRKKYSILALVDSGCSRCLIDEGLARRMGIPVDLQDMTLNGVHGSFKSMIAKVSFCLIGRKGESYTVRSAITRKDLHMPGPTTCWRSWAQKHPPFDRISRFLEDYKGEDVKMYLGLDVENLWLPEKGGVLESRDKLIRAHRSKLGWTITGPVKRGGMMPPLEGMEVMACVDEESSFDCATGESSTGESSDPDEESSLGGGRMRILRSF